MKPNTITTQLRVKLESRFRIQSTTCLFFFFLPQRLDPASFFFFLPEQLDLSSLAGLEYALKPKLISINTKEEIILLCCKES